MPPRDVAAAKASLRHRMRSARSSIPADERARLTGMVARTLFSLPEMGRAGTILLFYAFGTEVATAGMAERVHRDGKRLLLPYLRGREMEAAEVLPDEPLPPTRSGPREPGRRVAVDPAAVDVVVAPGLAFDRSGNRLGYGGGHYDRYLDRLRPAAVRVGVAFSRQLVDRVPVGPDDRQVDVVVTDLGAIRTPGGSDTRR